MAYDDRPDNSIEPLADGMVELLRQNLVANTVLVQDAHAGDSTIYVSNTLRFERGDKIALMDDFATHDPDSHAFSGIEFHAVKDYISDVNTIVLENAIQKDFLVVNNGRIQKTIRGGILYSKDVLYSDRDVIPFDQIAITVNEEGLSAEWLALRLMSNEFRLSINVYVKFGGAPEQEELAIRMRNAYATAIYNLLMHNIHVDLVLDEVPILQDANQGDMCVYIPYANRHDWPIDTCARYEVKDNFGTTQDLKIVSAYTDDSSSESSESSESPGSSDTSSSSSSLSETSSLSSTSSSSILRTNAAVIGGQFTAVNGVELNRLARFFSNGSADISFNPNANGAIYAMTMCNDDKIIVGGVFDVVGGTNRNYIALIDEDGVVESTFNPNPNGSVRSMALQFDDKLLIGGVFTQVGGQNRSHIARLNSNGTVDATFSPHANSFVRAIAMQINGKIVIGGNFTSINGIPRNRIARLNPDGSLDTSFNPSSNGVVYNIKVQSDGKILVGGSFSSIGGGMRNNIARLNDDGTIDTGFNANTNGSVFVVDHRVDGSILMGGSFGIVNGSTRQHLACLNSNGTLHPTFHPVLNGSVYAIYIQSDGSIFIGGDFNSVNGQIRNYLSRLNSDGSIDSFFGNTALNNRVYAIIGLDIASKQMTRTTVARLTTNNVQKGVIATEEKLDVQERSVTIKSYADSKTNLLNSVVQSRSEQPGPRSGTYKVCFDHPLNVDVRVENKAVLRRIIRYMYDSRVSDIEYGVVQKGSAILKAARLTWWGKESQHYSFPQVGKGGKVY